MKITEIPIEDITPYWRNPRKSDKAVTALKNSIEKYGFNQPIVVDEHNVIICGHTRYAALLHLKYKKIPCIRLDIPADKAKQYRIADNKVADFSDWNMNKLMAELREIEDIDSLQTVFLDTELGELISDEMPDLDDDNVTSDEIKDTDKTLSGRYKDGVKTAEDDLIDINCPKCGKKITIRKSDIIKESQIPRDER